MALLKFWLCPTAPVVRFECSDGTLGVATLLPASWDTEWRRVATDCPDAIRLELAEAADLGETDPRFAGYDVSADAAWNASDASWDARQFLTESPTQPMRAEVV